MCLYSSDVSSVELLQKYHQGIRSEIEARGIKFTECSDLGEALLASKHRDSAEVGAERRQSFFHCHQFVFIVWLLSSKDPREDDAAGGQTSEDDVQVGRPLGLAATL